MHGSGERRIFGVGSIDVVQGMEKDTTEGTVIRAQVPTSSRPSRPYPDADAPSGAEPNSHPVDFGSKMLTNNGMRADWDATLRLREAAYDESNFSHRYSISSTYLGEASAYAGVDMDSHE